MALAHGRRLPRAATAFEQEAIATLILSGRFVGFLPDHYAEAFVQRGQMRAVNSALLHYACDFVSVLRRSRNRRVQHRRFTSVCCRRRVN